MKDEKYRVVGKWIDAWVSQSPGFAKMELREYADGQLRVDRGDAIYLDEAPEYSMAHALLLMANKKLGV